VTERHTRQIHPGLGGVDDTGQSGKGQVTAQNAVWAAAGQRAEKLLRAGHHQTVAQQV
jgi:N-acetylmuramoyl-L-alanine amidase